MSGFVGFEQLRELVVRHGLGRVDVPLQQAEHVELLLHEFHVGTRVEPGGGHGREQLVLVAEAPVADLLALQPGDVGDARRRERDLQGAGTLVDLRDVRDGRALFARGQGLGDPGDGVVGLPLGEDRLRHDVRAALEDLHVQALGGVVPLVQRREVPGELPLGDPLQLQLHRRPPGRRGAGGGGVLVGAAAGREAEGGGAPGAGEQGGAAGGSVHEDLRVGAVRGVDVVVGESSRSRSRAAR